MTKSLRQIINDYKLGELTIYKNEHFYIEFSTNIDDDIEYYFEIDDDTFCGRFENKWKLLDTISNKESIFYDYLDELLNNNNV